MKSMTGYGRARASSERLEITVEASSINKRNLEVYASLPRDWQAVERLVNEAIRERLQRGKISVIIQVKDNRAAGGLIFDEEAVGQSLKHLRTLAESQGLSFEPGADTLLRLVSALEADQVLPPWEDYQESITEVLAEGLGALVEMRGVEGERLREDISQRLTRLDELRDAIEQAAQGTVPRYRELLLQRLKQTELELDLEDERILKEIALFADRIDTTEEITRLRSHLDQFGETMNSSESAIGRKLDFLCQEIHREINTIGSKANNLQITRHVIECKNELERIREQVQNVE